VINDETVTNATTNNHKSTSVHRIT